MQVLENAVRKLKMTDDSGMANDRIEPSFGNEDATPIRTQTVRAVPPPPARRPSFAELPDPDTGDRAPIFAETGGGGGGPGAGKGSRKDDEERKFGPWLTWFGAAASVVLVVGVSVWTYRLGQRDAMEVPVVAALEGPARVAPDDAGGLQVAHQGFAVNNVLEGNGVEAVAETVVTVPADNDLIVADAPQGELNALIASQAPAARPVQAEAEIAAVAPEAETELGALPKPLMPNGELAAAPEGVGADATLPEMAATAPELSGLTSPFDRAPVVQDSSAAQPAREVEEVVADAKGVTEEAAAIEVIKPVEVAALGPLPPLGQGSVYAPAVMRVPQARPANLNVAMANAVDAALKSVLNESPAEVTAEATPVVEPKPEPVQVASLEVIPLPKGTRMIQLGAYGSEAIARQQWDRLSSQHSDLLGTKEYYVQRTNNSGKIFYRLRVAGYESKTDTKSACAALSARGLPCITVTLN